MGLFNKSLEEFSKPVLCEQMPRLDFVAWAIQMLNKNCNLMNKGMNE